MGLYQRGPNVDQLRKYSISPHIYGTLRSSGEAENWELWKHGTLGAAILFRALLPHRVPIVTEHLLNLSSMLSGNFSSWGKRENASLRIIYSL